MRLSTFLYFGALKNMSIVHFFLCPFHFPFIVFSQMLMFANSFNEMLQNYCHMCDMCRIFRKLEIIATFLNKSLENETTKQRLYYFYNFFCENRQVILQLLLHFITTIHNSDNLVFVL